MIDVALASGSRRHKAEPRICLPRCANCQDLQISSQSNLANMSLAKTRFTDAHRNLDETTEIGEDQGCKRKAVRRTPLPKCASYQDVQSSPMVVQANISLQKLFI